MFGSLKEKLGKALGIFSKKIEEESETEKQREKEKAAKEPKKTERKPDATNAKKEHKKEKKQEITEEKEIIEKKENAHKHRETTRESKQKEEIKEDEEEYESRQGHHDKKKFLGIFGKKEEAKEKDSEDDSEKKKGIFSGPLIKITISEKKFEELFWDIELALLENNVAVEVIEKLKNDLKENIMDQKLNAFSLQKKINETFRESISGLFDVEQIDIVHEMKSKKPYVIAFIGVNGSGKTTNLAKISYMLKSMGFNVVIAACDTFRAAALQQIEEHASKIGVRLIKHDYGSDAAAVAFDAIKHAESKNADFVLIDTAGRSHSNVNLMDELKKVIRIAKPDLKVFVGDSLTGNDVVEQAKSFDEAVGIDAIILSKMDIDEKGGASISVSYVTKKPIIFTGTGQEYGDIRRFDKESIIRSLGL